MKRERFRPDVAYEKFISKLRLARQEKGISQRALAEKLHVHHSKINRAEDAKRALDIVEVRAWLQALGVPLVEFTREIDAALNTSDDTGSAETIVDEAGSAAEDATTEAE